MLMYYTWEPIIICGTPVHVSSRQLSGSVTTHWEPYAQQQDKETSLMSERV